MKRSLSYYIISGMLFLMVLTGVIISKRYSDSLSNTQKKLQTARMNLVSMKDAQVDMEKTIADLKAIVPSDFASRTPEEHIFIGLDELKFRMKNAEIVVTNMEYKGDEVSLPVTIKSSISGKAAGKDYALFMNDIGYLQSMGFPFFYIGSISMVQSQDRASVSYEIKGALKTLKTAEGRQ
ncbi:MAG: hypothetical protein ACOYU2_00075 [Nitrospirota bacterium]